jgi:hypothetical protein
MKARPVPVRAPDQTTYTWSLSKELKGKLLILSKKDTRPLSNWLTHVMEPQVETMLASRGIVVTDAMIEDVLKESAASAFRGMPNSRKR